MKIYCFPVLKFKPYCTVLQFVNYFGLEALLPID
uniref:Uncharacterized protein n=1 Tax=Anguilla anguilla TaxID=7936 RepID=A0A0E9WVQ5_ANGAN